MLRALIHFSLKNRLIVVVAAAVVALAGMHALRVIPLDAIPDLSDTQVIVYTKWPGQAPQLVQDQVTYPITTKMLSVPGARTVRGYSFYGYSLAYVIFDDGTDPYWARSRVLEYLSGMQGDLPADARPVLGPDATGVGWAFMYSINSDRRDLAELRSMQDWNLRYKLAGVDGVSEVASVGGFVRQYQISVDPLKLRAYRLAVSDVAKAVYRSNGEAGGRSIELSETEFMVRVGGYVHDLDDLRGVAVGLGPGGTPVRLSDVADVQYGPDMRRGVAELNGEGETVGGIVVVRYGADVRKVIGAVKTKLDEAMKSLPPDVHYTITYDRTSLIDRAVETLRSKLVEECLVVALVCLLFLLHLRSALVAVVVLPLAVLASFAIMNAQGISANIMSLGGIAIAIGAMVDAAIIMIENMHKHVERDGGKKPHWDIVRDASVEVGPTLFYSLLVITVSFLPIFTLQAQEGRLFKPLAFTKTYSMAAAALLSVTLAPILMGWFIRGRIPSEAKNPVSRLLRWVYEPLFRLALRFRWWVVALAVLVVAQVFLPWNALVTNRLPDGHLKDVSRAIGKAFPYENLGSEFMPPLDEGDMLYMPTTFPGVSVTKAKELLQQTDAIIRTFPEVVTVFGKAGRAETATDPAPLDMLETTIQLLPRDKWPAVDVRMPDGSVEHRPRTRDELVAALNKAVSFPGLTNSWTMPIRTRIDMLATGIKTPVGLKVKGPDLPTLEQIAGELEGVLAKVPGTSSVFGERVMGGNYLQVDIDRLAIARYGLTLGEVQDVVSIAVGGRVLGTTVQGQERYDILLRYNRDFRDSPEALARVSVPVKTGLKGGATAQVPLGELAKIRFVAAPMAVKSEDGVPQALVYVDTGSSDVGRYVERGKKAVDAAVADGRLKLPTGYSIEWSGQYEYMQHAHARLMVVVPLTLFLIAFIIYLSTRSLAKTAIVLLAVPFSLVGAFWMLYLADYHLSVAVWVGLIALAGLDAETGVVMLLYLDIAHDDAEQHGRLRNRADLWQAVHAGAVQRVRPKAMTATVIVAGLLPILWSSGAGADVMKRIAAPMVGGVVTSTLMELLVYPAIYMIWKGWRMKNVEKAGELP